VAVVDVDGDGNSDIYLAQNFYDWQSDAVRMDGGVSQLLLGDGRGGLQIVAAGESGLVLPENARAVCVTDVNHDQRPDFLVTVNDGPLAAFENQSGGDNRRLEIRLRGRRGNSTAVGARLELELSDGSHQTSEIYGGDGYLSQSTAAWFVGLGQSSQPKQIKIRWPNGQESSHPVDPNARQVMIEQPES
jgi:enediyne biosynthesis protein E4